jgi:hypothetical protein
MLWISKPSLYMSYKTNVLTILNVYIVLRVWFPDSAIKRALVVSECDQGF